MSLVTLHALGGIRIASSLWQCHQGTPKGVANRTMEITLLHVQRPYYSMHTGTHSLKLSCLPFIMEAEQEQLTFNAGGTRRERISLWLLATA